jgi:hypothetical protein
VSADFPAISPSHPATTRPRSVSRRLSQEQFRTKGWAGRLAEGHRACNACSHSPARDRAERGTLPRLLLAREIERPSYRERLFDARLRGAVTDHDVDLVRLPAQQDVRGSASAREAFEACSMNRNQVLQRPSALRPRPTAGRRGRLPAEDDDNGARRRKKVGRDLTAGRKRPNTGRSDDEERARVGYRAGRGRLDPLPARRDDDPNGMRRDGPPATAAPHGERGEEQGSKSDRSEAHLPLYESRPTFGPRSSLFVPASRTAKCPAARLGRRPRWCEPRSTRAGGRT